MVISLMVILRIIRNMALANLPIKIKGNIMVFVVIFRAMGKWN